MVDEVEFVEPEVGSDQHAKERNQADLGAASHI
jgi:hypothetical protein